MTAPVSAEDVAGMRLALAQAALAGDAGEVPVGAVVVRGGEVVASAYNETVELHHPTAHAEFLALHRALAVSGDDRLPDATLYVTLEPCAQCAGAIVLTKVGKVVFGAWDPKAGMAGSIHDLLRHPQLNHRAVVIGGVLGPECGALLQDFFSTRRQPMPLHPRLQELLDFLDARHAELVAAIARVPAHLRGVPPGADRWSVNDVVEHLALVAERMGERINQAASTARTAGSGPDPAHAPILPGIDTSKYTDRSQTITAPAAVTPNGRLEEAAVRARLEAAFARMREVLIGCDGVDLSQVTMPHQRFGEMNLYQWLAFAGGHEARHTAQIDEIAGQFGPATHAS